jgi:hypothetical protein
VSKDIVSVFLSVPLLPFEETAILGGFVASYFFDLTVNLCYDMAYHKHLACVKNKISQSMCPSFVLFRSQKGNGSPKIMPGFDIADIVLGPDWRP